MISFNDLNFFSKYNVQTLSYKNSNWKDYKIKKTFEDRLKESEKILNIYQDKIPVIINECCYELSDKVKRKMLLPKEMTVSQFIHTLRTRVNIKSEESVFIFINGSIPTSTTTMSYLYEKYKEKDKFLYISVLKENVFG